MRNSDQLLDDLNEKTSEEWNCVLAEEYGYEINEFINTIKSKYTFVPLSEDNIAHKIKKSKNKIKDKLVENKDEKIDVNSLLRDFNEISFEYGTVLSSHIFCGFNFIESDFSGVMFREMLINNTIADNADFRSVKFLQCTVIDSVFESAKFQNNIISKTYFYDCSFRNALLNGTAFYDCVFYNCDFMGADLDECVINTCLFHNCTLTNSSLKKSIILSSNVSYSTFDNSNLRETELYDTDLINSDFSSSNLDDVVLYDSLCHAVKVDEMYKELFEPKKESDEEVSFDGDEEDDD